MTNDQLQMTNDLKGKRVLVMGLGLHGGGVGTVKFLLKHGAKVTITDLRKKTELAPSLKKLPKHHGINLILGRHRKRDFLQADLIIKNPGVPPSSLYLSLARKYHTPITSDIGLFFLFSPAAIIGVTGTRGKSTTAYLIWKFLKTRYKRVFLGGNIRKSVLEFLPKLKRGDLVVLELSSFQLQDIALEKKSPQIAVLTNILKDHLNWHKNFQEYISAKSIIFKFQKPNDFLFANPHDRLVKKMARKAKGRVILPGLAGELRKIVDKKLGSHYRESVALAIAVAKHFHIPEKTIKKILLRFNGLPGRQERTATIGGVHFINDTTSTMPEATVAALNRFRNLLKKGSKLILIAGGEDKKLDFRPMVSAIKKWAEVLMLLPGTATKKILKNLRITNLSELRIKIKQTGSMEEAVRSAYKEAQSGDYILLSPGAASFGLFLNEFDRGDKFKEELKRLRNYAKGR